jgi:sirohydrochlorin ferrochelatase
LPLKRGAPKRAILLVDHGSRAPAANRVLASVARRLAKRIPDHVVRIAHMELAQPTIEAGIDACVRAGAREIVVHPFFLAPGRHARQDVPRIARAAARRHGARVRVTAPLGVHDALIDVILERIDAV